MSGLEDLGRLLRHGHGWLRVATRDALAGGAHVADEGDRWFIAVVRGLGRGAQRAERGVDVATDALVAQVVRLRPRWMRRRTPKERIEDLLNREGERLDFDVTQAQFRDFSERIATLLELVYTGAIRLDDVVFENGEKDAPGSGLDAPLEPREEMPEHEQSDEEDDRAALHVPEDSAP